MYGENHSVALRAVRSAPCWAASLMPAVHCSAGRLSRDYMLSKYSEKHYNFFFLEANIKELNSSSQAKNDLKGK